MQLSIHSVEHESVFSIYCVETIYIYITLHIFHVYRYVSKTTSSVNGVYSWFIILSKMFRLNDVKPANDEKIYSKDINCSGSKQFIAKTLPAMWDLMQTGPRYYCEVIEDSPCHLFFDFDEGNVREEWQKLKKMLNKIFKAIQDKVGHVRYEYLDASKGDKQSAHVVVIGEKYILQRPSDGRAFIYRLKEMFGELPLIDDKIYTRNRCFRMLGNSKYGENRPLVSGPWEMENWINTLVQPSESLEAADLGLSNHVPKVLRNKMIPHCVDNVLSWAGASDYRWKNELEWVWGGHLIKGKCAIAGRVHRKNNRYFIYKAPDKLAVGCHHCRKRINLAIPDNLVVKVQAFLQQVIKY
jgi:hypothetical protein